VLPYDGETTGGCHGRLLGRFPEEKIENEIKKRKCRWIGHTLRKPPETVTRQAITWNPSGKRRRGRPRNTWQRDTEKETKEMGEKWRRWPLTENGGVP